MGSRCRGQQDRDGAGPTMARRGAADDAEAGCERRRRGRERQRGGRGRRSRVRRGTSARWGAADYAEAGSGGEAGRYCAHRQ